MVKESVISKLKFAARRLDDLKTLINNNELSSDAERRQQIVQEFFFHIVGATDYVAQLVNEKRSLGINAEYVAVHKVAKQLNLSSNLQPLLSSLSENTRNNTFPKDPYSEYGLVYRMINYRNEVVHRNTNPFHFVLSEGPGRVAYFWLDPRDHKLGKSKNKVDKDMNDIFVLINSRCREVLNLL